jgi:hypothetical protein
MSIPIRRGVSTLWIAALAGCALPAVAAADQVTVTGTGGTLRVHSAPSLGSAVIGNLRDGTPIHIGCQTLGDMVVKSTVWDYIDSPQTGFVSDWYTTTPVVGWYSPGYKDCFDVIGPVPTPTPTPTPTPVTRDIASVALSYLGQTRVPAAVPRSWYVGPYWSGYCEAFVGWVTAGPKGRPYASAYRDYLGHRGRIHGGVPPRDTIVYWNPPESRGAGHIGISIGGGQVVSTYGSLGDRYGIAKNGYRTFRNYLGWAYP